jgi:replicative DNA helicase
MSQTDKLPPRNLEAEAAVVGSLLTEPDDLINECYFLKPDDFYSEVYKWIYEAIIALAADGKPYNEIAVGHWLLERGLLASLGGSAVLAKLVAMTPNPYEVVYYSEIVVKLAFKRRIIGLAGRIAKWGFNDQAPVEDDLKSILHGAETLSDEWDSRMGPPESNERGLLSL